MGNAERFGNFEIAKGADGRPIELTRSPAEVVLLAFNLQIRRLVELHVLEGSGQDQARKLRLDLASQLGVSALPRVLSHGDDEGTAFYATNLFDGEPLENYVNRRGALPAPTAFSLLLNLLDELLVLQRAPELIDTARLGCVQMALLEDTFLQLRVLDYGLSSHEGAGAPEVAARRLVGDCCHLLFHLIAGKLYEGEDCDRAQALTSLPSGLRAIMRVGLPSPESESLPPLEKMRDAVREALSVLTRDAGLRLVRKHLVAVESMVPCSSFRELLLADVPLEQLLGGRWTVEETADSQRYPLTILANDAKTDAPVTVHLLSPRRIISNEHYIAVPSQVWRFQPEKHPNILRSLTLWESPDLTFLTEERGPGFPLSRLIADRVFLNPSEVLILLRQVKNGVAQALECGVEKLDLNPSNIELRLGTQPNGRELEKLLQKRLDAWPKFQVMLRPHITMRSLYEPLLLDTVHVDDEGPEALNYRRRSFVALAAYLLSGRRQNVKASDIPDSTPEPLTSYVLQCLEYGPNGVAVPGMDDFLKEFERRSQMTSGESISDCSVGFVLPPPRSQRASSPQTPLVVMDSHPPETAMESAGSVSDFDEDLPPIEHHDSPAPATRSYAPRAPRPSTGSFTTSSAKRSVIGRRRMPMWILASGVIVCAVMLTTWFMARGGEAKGGPVNTPSNTQGVESAKLLPQDRHTGAADPSAKAYEIRRALVPTEQEREALRRTQSSIDPQKMAQEIIDRGLVPLWAAYRIDLSMLHLPEIKGDANIMTHDGIAD